MSPDELPTIFPDPVPSRGLDLDGLVAQRDRYAQIGENVLRVERECCPFFDLGFDPGTRVLTVAVDADEQVPALNAIVFALGTLSGPST